MKVNDASQIRALSPEKPVEPGRTPAAQRGEPEDRVSTAESGSVAAAIAAASTGASTARAAKLQAIEAAVRQGTYRPDPARIAQQILEDAELSARLQAIFGK
ncbi:MAG: flagellar biosynthesis anti-sigma factor FlgM [Anaeromyxobacteraceae bacterium]